MVIFVALFFHCVVPNSAHVSSSISNSERFRFFCAIFVVADVDVPYGAGIVLCW